MMEEEGEGPGEIEANGKVTARTDQAVLDEGHGEEKN